ncbi:MAG: DEAD/DEAH box helicase family protein [Anaerolineae bacterium]|nr:DEAD/DEAH box helicase family protein [Anaerolineae bacterium]MDW8067477.1 DEAD/DEAH box helicase family protein [Anaerolineae bacterium]
MSVPILLQRMVESIPDELLPPGWRDLDFATFSATKRLWDYQQQALRNAAQLLWKYYDEFADYRPGEPLDVNQERRRRLWEWYRETGLPDGLDIDLRRLPRRTASLLREHYPIVPEGRLSYEHFINRMGFWMATGSGKTLVIVKLVELLWRLVRQGELPPNDILILTHRDDLIGQLLRHVDEFNRGPGDLRILLRELREYPAIKRETLFSFRDQEVIVFYYRSDNLSDEQKERIVDFRNYDNDGRWFVLLDEAHKGDKEDSRRQHIYSVLSRNGFLFNFSATFTDPRDIITTVFNFNLARFIRAGYGKHILILQQETRPFRDREDYTGDEKQRVVLKALMMTACAQRARAVLQEAGYNGYHRPLLLVLVNSVHTEEADLQLFFRELVRIGRGEVPPALWEQARQELLEELRRCPGLIFEDEPVPIDGRTLRELTFADILRWVFHSEAPGEMEVLVRPSNRQEIAFKLKSAARPFALIKIGDISHWLQEKLAGYEINETFDDESLFACLNEESSDITILMGSRTFYEGWDSNRPNAICYINIGVGEEARKFILQSLGRGVRIEPVPGLRKRLLPLVRDGAVPGEWARWSEPAAPLETLVVFATNRAALQAVIDGLRQERAASGLPGRPHRRERAAPAPPPPRLALSQEEYERLRRFVRAADDRVLLARYDLTPGQIGALRRALEEPAPDRWIVCSGPDTPARAVGDRLRAGDPLETIRRWLRFLEPTEPRGPEEPVSGWLKHPQESGGIQ